MQDELLAKLAPAIGSEKIPISSPTLSPSERKKRRLAFRNEWNLHKITSAKSGASIISFFDEKTPFKVYSSQEWWSDNWNAQEFVRDFDQNHPFFDQFHALQLAVPRPALVNNKSDNSDYCNFADENKDCYMITSANRNSNCFYSFLIVNCKDSSDCLWCTDSELLYECTDCQKSYNLKFSSNCSNCSDSYFLKECRGVRNSLFCSNLENKDFHICNQPVSPELFKQWTEYLKGSHSAYQKAKQIFTDFLAKTNPPKNQHIINCENVSGEYIYNSKNILDSKDVYDSIDLAYSHDGLNAKDCLDICFFDGAELCYESMSLIGFGYLFCIFCRDSANLIYCDNCFSCKDCFACVGLRNKQYCIFNRQLNRDEYSSLASQIISHMRQTGEWGEFFPMKYSLFPYEQTLANEYFPLAVTVGSNLPHGNPSNLPDNISQIDETTFDPILTCEITGEKYRIVTEELKFYKRHELPLPRKAPAQRRKERISDRAK